MFLAFQDMLRALADDSAQQCWSEYDDIKGSSIALGPLIVADGLHVLKVKKMVPRKGYNSESGNRRIDYYLGAEKPELLYRLFLVRMIS